MSDEIEIEVEFDLAVGSRIMLKDDKDGSDLGWYEVTRNIPLEGKDDGHYLLTLEKADE